MPETRYAEEYTYPEGMKAEDKIPANAQIKQIPYEVSDEQLAQEAQEAKVIELVAKPIRTTSESNQLIDLLASKLGYELSESKQITPVAIS